MFSESAGEYSIGFHVGATWEPDSYVDSYRMNFVPRIGESVEIIIMGTTYNMTVIDVKHTVIDNLHHVQVLLWRK